MAFVAVRQRICVVRSITYIHGKKVPPIAEQYSHQFKEEFFMDGVSGSTEFVRYSILVPANGEVSTVFVHEQRLSVRASAK